MSSCLFFFSFVHFLSSCLFFFGVALVSGAGLVRPCSHERGRGKHTIQSKTTRTQTQVGLEWVEWVSSIGLSWVCRVGLGFGWFGLGWLGLLWVGLDWLGFDLAGIDRLGWIRLVWVG